MPYILAIGVLLVGCLAYRRLARRIEWQAQIATEQLSMYCAFMDERRAR